MSRLMIYGLLVRYERIRSAMLAGKKTQLIPFRRADLTIHVLSNLSGSSRFPLIQKTALPTGNTCKSRHILHR